MRARGQVGYIQANRLPLNEIEQSRQNNLDQDDNKHRETHEDGAASVASDAIKSIMQ